MAAPYSFYELQLFVLAAYCICSLLLERHVSLRKQKAAISTEEGRGPGWKMNSGETPGYTKLARTYLLVYAVVMGADWLQVSSTLIALVPCPEFSQRRDHTSTPNTASNTNSQSAPSLYSS